MMRIVSILVVIILIGGGFGVSALSKTKTKTIISPIHPDDYNMVIIAPEEFSTLIQPLIEHKNSNGVHTYLKTTEEIYTEFDGVDKPEQIKYFIKNSIETQHISYVLFVGGLKHYIWNKPKDTINAGEGYWYVPVRYSNIIEPPGFQWYDPGFVSDLYYADIYDENGNFSSWDTNENGVYGEWNLRDISHEKDIIDLYPDICVGRLACRNKYEVKVVVDKIITYESESYGEEWFDRILLASGNGFNDPPTQYLEGEVHCDYIFEQYMSEYTPTKLYGSNVNSNTQFLPKPKNVIRELSKGCGFLLIDAHGKPGRTKTFWLNDFNTSHTILDMTNLPFLRNGYKLPIALLGGCCNARINVSVLYPDLKRTIDMFGGWDVIGLSCPKSICWGLVSKKGGGSIASIGYTGFSYVAFGEQGDLDGNGVNDPDFIEAKHGYLFSSFFKQLDDGVDILGEAWRRAIIRYLDTWPAMEEWVDAKNVELLILLGDPSLKIGGYNTNE